MPTLRAFVWRRHDFRESSRVVALVTRDEGRIHVLAKGAHRPGSQFLGRLDFLNLVDATCSAGGDRLRLLSRVTLVHEPRALRTPARFAAAAHVAELVDHLFHDGRPDPSAFDLLAGALTLVERCPKRALPRVVAGFELRFLALLGVLPAFDRCSACGRTSRELFAESRSLALHCATHAQHRAPLRPSALHWLATTDVAPGRTWPTLADVDGADAALALLGEWVATTLERRPRLRALALAESRG